MRERILFIHKFLKHGTRIASVTPSSRWMCRELARDVSPDRPQRILELGAGTGVVTREIEKRMHPDSTLVICEQDADFVRILRKNHTRATLVDDSFERITDHINHDHFDAVVSGLPVPSFDDQLRGSLFSMIATLAPDARYAQLTEFPLIYKPLYKREFRSVRFSPVPLNIPPGGVYHCHGKH